MDLEQAIIGHLDEIIDDARLLFAIESGSRAWQIESVTSDYDIRFVFAHQPSRYLRLFPELQETKTVFLDEAGAELDFSGWDIFKYLRLLKNSNPATLEWVRSPIVYVDSSYRAMIEEISADFSRFTLFKHYQSLARSNYKKYIQDKLDPSLKKYLYVLRGLFDAIYIVENDAFPPLPLVETMAALEDNSTWDIDVIAPEVRRIISVKRSGDELDTAKASPEINFWISETFDRLTSFDEEIKSRESSDGIPAEKLESLLEDILQG